MDDSLREAMSNDTTAEIRISYQNIDGYHVFTSDDLYGLYIAHKEPRESFDALVPAIKLLLKLNHGVDDCEIIHLQKFRDFEAARKRSVAHAETPHPAIIESQRFAIQCRG